jgi:hypothetical protein
MCTQESHKSMRAEEQPGSWSLHSILSCKKWVGGWGFWRQVGTVMGGGGGHWGEWTLSCYADKSLPGGDKVNLILPWLHRQCRLPLQMWISFIKGQHFRAAWVSFLKITCSKFIKEVNFRVAYLDFLQSYFRGGGSWAPTEAETTDLIFLKYIYVYVAFHSI